MVIKAIRIGSTVRFPWYEGTKKGTRRSHVPRGTVNFTVIEIGDMRPDGTRQCAASAPGRGSVRFTWPSGEPINAPLLGRGVFL